MPETGFLEPADHKEAAMRTSTLAISALLTLCASNAVAADASSPPGSAPGSSDMSVQEMLKPFPAAKPRQTRWVIQLPAQSNEADWRVELIPGKQMQIDCNQHHLGGKLHAKTLKGWGYGYYEFISKGQITSTLMACPESSKRQAFVAAESLMLRYNSRLPLVVYTDKAYQLQYRFWRADATQAAKAQ